MKIRDREKTGAPDKSCDLSSTEYGDVLRPFVVASAAASPPPVPVCDVGDASNLNARTPALARDRPVAQCSRGKEVGAASR